MTHRFAALLRQIVPALIWAAPVLATPAVAQSGRPGQIASSTAGQAGQRSTAAQVASGTAPLARLDGRIANRVQSRIRNRIDESYDPQANAASPFETASDRLRAAGAPRRR